MGRIQDFGQLSIRFFTLMINGKRRKLVLELIFEFISMKDFERLTLIDMSRQPSRNQTFTQVLAF